jgi:GntR family transcriptional regulator/MocR family aminotransferase
VAGIAAGLHVLLELSNDGDRALPRQHPWRQLGVKALDLYRHPDVHSERGGLVMGYAGPAPSAWSAALNALIRLLP